MALSRIGVGLHLARRFFGSLRPGGPPADEERWVTGLLNQGELAIWTKMNNPDRRHAVGVARAVESELDAQGLSASPEVLAAALLHDCGKVASKFGTFSRVGATLFWAVVDDDRADIWLEADASGLRGELARYRRHPELGGAMLRAANSSDLAATWAEEHHQPSQRWSVDPQLGQILKTCDDD